MALRVPHRALLPVVGLLVLTIWTPPSLAQDRTVPRPDYFLAFSPYYNGEFRTAATGFRSAARGGVRSTVGRWVDSICYYAMMGESLYQMGENAAAMEQFNAALELAMAHSEWKLRINFPGGLEPTRRTVRRPITWGNSQRGTMVAEIPSRMLSFQGRLDLERVLQEGGVATPPTQYPLDAAEIVRCTALALRRRAELLGPTGEHDEMTARLIQVFSRRSAPPNHWSQVWASAHLGLAYAAAGRTNEAVAELQNAISINGQLDHTLTPIVLLELGKLAFDQGNHAAAARYFMEASIAAAHLSQFDIVEESLRWGAMNHFASGGKSVYEPVVRAIPWAVRQSRFLETSLNILAAEQAAVLGDLSQAANFLADAQRGLRRSEMAAGPVGHRYQYVLAVTNFRAGNLNDGAAAITTAIAGWQQSSLRLLQIGLVDQFYSSGIITARTAEASFERVLREPTEVDWRVQPLESLAFVSSPLAGPLERWFELALERNAEDKALEISDRIRRQRFFSSQPMGGRLTALRWILEAPPEALSETARLQRRDLLVEYPRYEQLSREATQIKRQLRQLPVVAQDDQERREQQNLLGQLARHSSAQEALLYEMAVSRVATEFAFPPQRSFEDIRQRLDDRSIMLVFFNTRRHLYAFAVSQTEYSMWRVESPSQVRDNVSTLLQRMGHMSPTGAIPSNVLEESEWKPLALRLLQTLTNHAPASAWEQYDELIIVPDGVLWYLPFEALQVGDQNESRDLLSLLSIRYAPTAALAVPDDRPVAPLARTLIVSKPPFRGGDEKVVAGAVEQLVKTLPDAVHLESSLPAPSSVSNMMYDRLVVLGELDVQGLPFSWSPLPNGRGSGNALSNWMRLPWGAPEQIVLPGFETAAAGGLRSRADGDEIFLAVCGLMASGSRTVLLSRWRTAGASMGQLTTEFTQELPFGPAAQSWQRAVRLLRAHEADWESEPRVRRSRGTEALSHDHPFFWSGYMVIDTGRAPLDPHAPPQQPPADPPDDDQEPVEPEPPQDDLPDDGQEEPQVDAVDEPQDDPPDESPEDEDAGDAE